MADQLDPDSRDRLAFITKLAASLLPVIGGPLAELITEIIPRQRQERIVEYLRQLDVRLAALEQEKVARILADAEKVDLIESGGYLSARATTTERISRIAQIVYRGLKSTETHIIRRKRLLGLFAEVDDDEFLLLNDYGHSFIRLDSNARSAIGQPSPAHLGSSKERLDDEELYDLGKQNLLRLGLLRRKFGNVKKGQYPPFDAQEGGFKSQIEISYLGRMLLRETGVDLPF